MNNLKLHVIHRLWGYLYAHKLIIALALLLSIASNLLALVGPMLAGWAIDAIEPGKGAVVFEKVFFYCALMLAFYVLSSALSYVLSVLMINLSRKVSYKMRKDVFERLVELPVGFFDSHQTGDIISRISYDIDTVNSSLSTDLLQICTSVITVIGSFAMMLIISPVMIIIFLVTIPISVVFTKWQTGKLRPLFKKRSEKLGELNGYVEEITSGLKTVKAYNREETMIDRFNDKNYSAVEAYYKADYFACSVGPVVNFINNLSLSAVSVFGSLLFLFGHLSLGSVSSFVLYSRKFSGPINEMANIVSELSSAVAAAERVFRLIDEQPEPSDAPNAETLRDVSGSIKLDDVSFGYTGDKEIIHKLSLNAEKGSLIAIVGPTGAGKTTIINLLMRFYDPDSGAIYMDEHELQRVTRESLRLSYSMVLQDTWLFYGTVFENIAYGKENATREEVITAVKAADIHDFIMSLPDGYDTILSDNAVNISKGQKQLLTIARAMLLEAHILILDEATSNVDTQTELKIQEAMYKLMENKTCFVIAHRLSTIQNADLILVVREGEIVEQGTHAELIKLGGFYAELYNSQFEASV